MALETSVQLELRPDLADVLERIAENEGLPKEQVASQALEVWVESYKKHGPAFSRRRQVA